MQNDRQGNRVSGATVAAVELYDRAIHSYNIYRGDPIALLDAAIDEAPDFAMAYLAKAHIFATSSEPGALAEVRRLLHALEPLALNERERSHAAALRHVAQGEWSEAAVTLDHHLARFPRDIVAVQAGHLIDFLRGNARNLRDRLTRVLPDWSPQDPGHSILRGMLAFGLEETGDYARAEAEGRHALADEPLDCWAHHAVTHVMEMQGRAEDGLGWMLAREPYWSGDDNLFKVHNWWHCALFNLDLGRKSEAVALYDEQVRRDRSETALDLVDASALLWRLHLSDVDLGDRWNEVADAWDQHADGETYPFNDWHAVIAWLGAGREADIDRNVAALEASADGSSETSRWTRTFALPLIDGFRAFWRADYDTAVGRLYRARYIANVFGGSHAQRDIIDWTLVEAALRGGNKRLARALANERIALKPHSHVNLKFAARALGDRKSDRHAA